MKQSAFAFILGSIVVPAMLVAAPGVAEAKRWGRVYGAPEFDATAAGAVAAIVAAGAIVLARRRKS